MTFGVIFHENHLSKKITSLKGLAFMWLVFTMFLTMAFVGNLKSSLVRKTYQKRTLTLDQLFEEDKVIYISVAAKDFFDLPTTKLSPIYMRVKCQTEKHNSHFGRTE